MEIKIKIEIEMENMSAFTTRSKSPKLTLEKHYRNYPCIRRPIHAMIDGKEIAGQAQTYEYIFCNTRLENKIPAP